MGRPCVIGCGRPRHMTGVCCLVCINAYSAAVARAPRHGLNVFEWVAKRARRYARRSVGR